MKIICLICECLYDILLFGEVLWPVFCSEVIICVCKCVYESFLRWNGCRVYGFEPCVFVCYEFDVCADGLLHLYF